MKPLPILLLFLSLSFLGQNSRAATCSYQYYKMTSLISLAEHSHPGVRARAILKEKDFYFSNKTTAEYSIQLQRQYQEHSATEDDVFLAVVRNSDQKVVFSKSDRNVALATNLLTSMPTCDELRQQETKN